MQSFRNRSDWADFEVCIQLYVSPVVIANRQTVLFPLLRKTSRHVKQCDAPPCMLPVIQMKSSQYQPLHRSCNISQADASTIQPLRRFCECWKKGCRPCHHRVEKYHGGAVNPKHLSIWERLVSRRGRYFDPSAGQIEREATDRKTVSLA